MSKHTPGKWKAAFGIQPGYAGSYAITADERVVAEVFNGNDAHANASLVAASPELLAVTKLILKEWEAPTDGVQPGELIARLSQYADLARHAIKKAEGV